MEVKRVVEEWEIWDKEEEAAKSEAEARGLVPEKFHKWIKVFSKKQSEQMKRDSYQERGKCTHCPEEKERKLGSS